MGTAADERAMAAAGEGCLGRARDDEIVFVLRSQDALMADLVDLWATRLVVAAVREKDDALAERMHAKAESARKDARDAREWQRANGCKMPD